jgi:hypothetical protein
MAELLIRNERLAWRILDIARRENRTVEDVLETMVTGYQAAETGVQSDEPEPGTSAALLKYALEAGIASEHPVDTSDRSREILQAEFGDYLRRRLDEQSETD